MVMELITLVADYGWRAMVAIGIVAILWRIAVPLLVNKLKKISFVPLSKPETHHDLKLHSFFNNAEYRMVAEIPSLEMIPNKPVRQQLFRDLLYIETKIIYDVCMDIVRTDMTEWSEDKWVAELGKKINEIITMFHNKTKDEGIPEIVSIRYSKWHSGSYEMLYGFINSLGDETLYSNNVTRTNTFLLLMNLFLITTIADAERTLKDLNGEISGQIYKNKVIED